MFGRRGFVAILGGAALGGGLGLVLRSDAGTLKGPSRLRPPGAGLEAEFLSACIRCSQCVEACPYDSIRPSGPADGLAAGAPWIDSRHTPCFLCRDHDALLCVLACPTAALTDPGSIDAIRMGTAEIDPGRCLAFNGVMCRACWHACPYPNAAIRYDSMLRPVVGASSCIGCGLCDQACLAEPSAIHIRPGGEG
ncbi:MAG: 4Fe-4S dicluster domain-containing protein [Planctomycetes bacterium]|nr:4Fe-4S dicluster domain-containing protein [Planctomycetota bacterium]